MKIIKKLISKVKMFFTCKRNAKSIKEYKNVMSEFGTSAEQIEKSARQLAISMAKANKEETWTKEK